MHRPVFATLALAIAAAATVPAFAQSQTIRIEPRPYYGAVVTMEQGVRVWRPLPPTSHMIINPTGSPVNLNIADVRENITSHNYVHTTPQSPAYGPAHTSAPAYLLGRGARFNRFGLRGRGGHAR
jgi:hypothetical protein